MIDTTTVNPATNLPSLELTIPAGCSGGYSGFTLVPGSPVDLSAYNALTFYAKASAAVTLATSGIGNDGSSPVQTYSAEVDGQFALTTAWQQYTIPMPAPAQAKAMPGLFHIAQGAESGTGAATVSLWLNDVRYVTQSPAPTPSAETFPWAATTLAPGATSQFPGSATVSFSSLTQPETKVGAGWFVFDSSSPDVATVNGSVITAGSTTGTTTLTATLDGMNVPQSEVVTVSTTTTPQAPTTSPAAPTANPVVAIYSPTYNATAVWTYDAGFCGKDSFVDYAISGGDKVLEYTLTQAVACLSWADGSVGGSVGTNLNVSAYTTLHVDLWTPAPPPVIAIRLVDFSSGTQTANFYVTYGSGVAASCTAATWCSLDIPLSSGSTVPPYKALGQMLIIAQSVAGTNISSGTYSLFIDNFYFH